MSRDTRSTAAYSGGPGGSDTPVWDCSQDGHRSRGDHRSSADPHSIRYLEGRQPDQQSRSPIRGSVSRKFPLPRGFAIRVVKPKPAWYKQSEWGERSVRANRRAYIHGSRECVVCGMDFTFPTADNEQLGSGKYTVGPGVATAHVFPAWGFLFFTRCSSTKSRGAGILLDRLSPCLVSRASSTRFGRTHGGPRSRQ
jgi:hypothetical protein